MSWLRELLERHTWRPLRKQRQTGRRQRLTDPGHHRGELAQARPMILKDPDRDCLASTPGYELTCDLPKDHDQQHYDAEYGVVFQGREPDDHDQE